MPLPRSRALRALGGALAAPALAGYPAALRAQPRTVVKVGFIPVDVSGNVFYAADLGLFAKTGLDVQLQPMGSGPALAQAVAGGAIDIGISNVATIAAARLRGLPFKFIAPAAVVVAGPKQTDIVMVRKDSPIKNGADMNGKTIAINGLRDLQEIEAKGYVDRFGGDSKTIKFVEVPFPAMGGALEQNRVDIIFPTEPFSTASRSTALHHALCSWAGSQTRTGSTRMPRLRRSGSLRFAKRRFGRIRIVPSRRRCSQSTRA
jgi:ABC-type nitrate/sulfonate/bicarbonate transport system substrate-binding protein